MLQASLSVWRNDEEAVACVRRIGDPHLGHQVDLAVQRNGEQAGMVSLYADRAADMRRWAVAVLECAAKAEEAERAAPSSPEDLTEDELTGEEKP